LNKYLVFYLTRQFPLCLILVVDVHKSWTWKRR